MTGPVLSLQQQADIITHARHYGSRKGLPEVLVGWSCIVTQKNWLGRVRLERDSATITWEGDEMRARAEMIRDLDQIRRDRKAAEKKPD